METLTLAPQQRIAGLINNECLPASVRMDATQNEAKPDPILHSNSENNTGIYDSPLNSCPDIITIKPKDIA